MHEVPQKGDDVDIEGPTAEGARGGTLIALHSLDFAGSLHHLG